MHRSGTSCIARILNLNGISLGDDIMSSKKDNPAGFWENWYFYKINNDILKNSNGDWDSPPEKIN